MSDLSPQQSQALAEMVSNANAGLEQAAQAAASHAFNLGCSVGMLPALVITAAAYFSTSRGGWVAAAITLVFMLLALAAFANLTAYISRKNTLRRIYRDEIQPQLAAQLSALNLTSADFEQFTQQNLPPEAAIRNID